MMQFFVSTARAAGITIDTGIPGMTNVSTAGPAGWISAFYNFALIAAGLLAFGAIVYGGIKYSVSGGNPSGQSEGRSWIYSALLGLLLLGGAWLILNTINPNLVKLQVPSLTPLSGVPSGAGGTYGQKMTVTPPNACGGSNVGTCQAGQTCQLISGAINIGGGPSTAVYGCK